MKRVKTKHTTKNYAVYQDGEVMICVSYGTVVARFDTAIRHVSFTKDWNYSPTTINHVKWFFHEVCGCCTPTKHDLESYVESGVIPIINPNNGQFLSDTDGIIFDYEVV